MSCGRICLVALFFCTPLALAQGVPDSHIPPAATPSEPWRILPKPNNNVQQVPGLRIPPAAAPSEPWRILPGPDWDKGGVVMTPEIGPEGIIVSSDGTLAGGTCYAIRSYVVAPDAKDTDSVHPDGYSTCIPATNFRLKTPDDYFAR